MRALFDALQPIATVELRPRPAAVGVHALRRARRPDGERAAFAMKVHHSVTDGVGGMALLAHFVDLVPDAPEAPDADVPAALAPEDARMLDVMRALARAHVAGARSVSRSAFPASVVRATAARDPRSDRHRDARRCARRVRSRARSRPRRARCRRHAAAAVSAAGSRCSTFRSTTCARREGDRRRASTTCSSPRSSAACAATTNGTAPRRSSCA